MSDDNKISKVRDAADAVKGLVKAVPIYEDAVQPAAKEVGKGLETIVKAVNVALAPLKVLIWGYDQIERYISSRIPEKLRNVPPERIVTPNPIVAGPALMALTFAGNEETLREMYANLLATSMDSKTAHKAHPGFVEIIRNMSPDEARIIRLFATTEAFPLIDVHAEEKEKHGNYMRMFANFSLLGREAGCHNPELAPNYLDNLCRLGLLQIPDLLRIIAPGTYEPLESDQELQPIKEQIEKIPEHVLGFRRKLVRITVFGIQFINACVFEKPRGE